MLVTSIPQYIQGLTNAKADLTTTDLTTLYTAPEDSGNADTITVTLVSGSDTFSLFKVKAVSANTTVELLSKDLILQNGEVIKVQAATANRLHVVASVQELSKTRTSSGGGYIQGIV